MLCEIIADSCVLDVAWFIFIRTDKSDQERNN